MDDNGISIARHCDSQNWPCTAGLGAILALALQQAVDKN